MVRMKGSHRQFHHPSKIGTVTVSGKLSVDIPIGTLNSIMQYTVIIEKGKTGFGAYVPDLPGCVAVGDTPEEVGVLIREAIEFHLEGMKQEGLTIPEPVSSSQLVEVAA